MSVPTNQHIESMIKNDIARRVRDRIVQACPDPDVDCIDDQVTCFDTHPVHAVERDATGIRTVEADLDKLAALVADVMITDGGTT